MKMNVTKARRDHRQRFLWGPSVLIIFRLTKVLLGLNVTILLNSKVEMILRVQEHLSKQILIENSNKKRLLEMTYKISREKRKSIVPTLCQLYEDAPTQYR